MISAQTLYLLRHGETAFNLERRLQGQQDSPLTERGRGQAKAHGRLLKTLIDPADGWRLIASPLGRTLATARLVCAELGWTEAAIETDDRLKEVGFGDWEGLTRPEIEDRFPSAWAERRQNRWRHVVPGGESFEMVAVRAASFLDAVEGRVIVVGHGAAGRVLRGLYGRPGEAETLVLDEPQDAIYRLSNGTMTKIEHGD